MNEQRISSTMAAKIVGLSDEAIRNHIQAGRLPAERVGMKGWYRIQIADVKALAKRFNYPMNEDFLRELEQ